MEDLLAQVTELQDYVYGLAAAPDFATSGVCFAAHYSGLSCSKDGGVTWRPALTSLALDAPLPATSAAIARDGTVFAGVPGGIVSSLDGGATWRSAPLPSPPPFISALAVSPRFERDGTVFAGTMEDGVFVSSDCGLSWQAWNIGLLDHTVLCLAVSPAFERDALLLAGTESGIFFSTNGGRFWHEAAFPMDHAPVLSLALSSAFELDGMIFAGTAAHGLCSSRDRGQSWISHPMPGSGAVNAVLLAPDFSARPHLLALVDDLLLISRDGGDTWSPCSPGGESGVGVASVAAPLGLDADRPLLVGLVDGGVQRYTISTARGES
jgi:photosystem II stability/assembly factor-like uncharacterized protein